MTAADEAHRQLILETVNARAQRNGGFLRRVDLSWVELGGGVGVRVIDPARGIRNPREMDATLSVVSSPDGPYADREVAGGLFHYSYRTGTIQGDNAKLRRAYELGLPIILLRKIRDGEYVPYAPVYVVDDLVDQREFLLSLDESVGLMGGLTGATPIERRYREAMVRQRLHQREFRGRVIAAYRTHCAICRLRHGELLDAAHIIGDAEDDGAPLVSNGLSLCKIHHAAFDRNLLGVSPDYVVHIDHRLLDEIDGPMLRHGLQEMHGTSLTLPERRGDRPDRDRLKQRFTRFQALAS